MTDVAIQPTVSAPPENIFPHPWNPDGSGSISTASLEGWVQARLARHQQAIDRLLAIEGPRTPENTLRRYDEAVAELSATGSQTALLNSVYPEKAIRDAAQDLTQVIAQAGVALGLNQDVYKALSGIPLDGLDDATRHYLKRTLLQYRLAGVDKDDASRARIKELQEKATLLSLTFSRNVQENVNTVTVEEPAELYGLPADFLQAHQAGADGKITLTTDFPWRTTRARIRKIGRSCSICWRFARRLRPFSVSRTGPIWLRPTR
jgi:thimet oligopeptidase